MLIGVFNVIIVGVTIPRNSDGKSAKLLIWKSPVRFGPREPLLKGYL